MTRSSVLCGLLAFSGLTALSTGCVAPNLGPVCPLPANASAADRIRALQECFAPTNERYYDLRLLPPIDLLLVMGNTPGMLEKQRALALHPGWAAWLTNPSMDLHVGIVSTDVGAWVAADQPFAQPAGACDSFAGDDGALQAVSCWERANQTAAERAACAALCPDRRYLPTSGDRFIALQGAASNVPRDWQPPPPKEQGEIDFGPLHALRCMVPLGESGCTVSSPLEAARRALDGHRRENTGFRRPGSILMVLFVTDREDCSLRATERAANDPRTQDCAAAPGPEPAHCFQPGPYRCAAFDLQCDQPLAQSGPKSFCRPRPAGPLEPVDTYQQFFRDLSAEHRALIINALVPTPALGQGAAITALQSPGTFGSSGLGLAPSCTAASDPTFVGLPQHRLSDLRAPWALPTWDGHFRPPMNLCSIDPDPNALFGAVPIWLENLPLCIRERVKRVEGRPQCLIGDVDARQRDALPDHLMPLCSRACCAAFAESSSGLFYNREVARACEAEAESCYCMESVNQACQPRGGDLFATWHVPGGFPSRGTTTSVHCAVESTE